MIYDIQNGCSNAKKTKAYDTLKYITNMGLLTLGTPLSWEDTKKHAEFIKKHGIIQFINLYKRLKDRQRDTLKWGDEVRLLLFVSRLVCKGSYVFTFANPNSSQSVLSHCFLTLLLRLGRISRMRNFIFPPGYSYVFKFTDQVG